jgi:hypothetical protein
VLHASDLYTLIDERAALLTDVDRKLVGQRLSRLNAITKYIYHVEVISNLGYDEVTEIFIRVNSRGRALKTTDLALATLSAKWPGVMQKLEDERDEWVRRGYPAFDLAFLARTLAAIATEQRSLAGFKDTPTDGLSEGWEAAKRGIRHIVNLLDKNAGIETSTLLPSTNALIPLAVYLGSRRDVPLVPEDANALLYWLFGAFITGRYNQSGDTRIAEDAKAVRGPNPIDDLYRNLGLLGERLEVSEQSLLGKGAGSAYFILSYLASKQAGATDWYTAVRIGLDATGASAIEYHHIHPQATLKKNYSKSEINDLANLAFISARANKMVSSRSPAEYFPEIGDDELRRHFVPLDPALRTPDRYPEFVAARRELLASAMTQFLDHFRPPKLIAAVAEEPGPSRHLDVTIFRSDGSTMMTRFMANVGNGDWVGIVPLGDIQRFLSDVEDGHAASLAFGEDTVTIPGGAESLEVPVGPLTVTGTLDDWRSMLERELADIVEDGDPGSASSPWVGERQVIAVIEAE